MLGRGSRSTPGHSTRANAFEGTASRTVCLRIFTSICASSHMLFRKPNIFDNMLAIMEKYAYNLEGLVQERTNLLYEEKKKTDMLLYQMLPRWEKSEYNNIISDIYWYFIVELLRNCLRAEILSRPSASIVWRFCLAILSASPNSAQRALHLRLSKC